MLPKFNKFPVGSIVWNEPKSFIKAFAPPYIASRGLIVPFVQISKIMRSFGSSKLSSTSTTKLTLLTGVKIGSNLK